MTSRHPVAASLISIVIEPTHKLYGDNRPLELRVSHNPLRLSKLRYIWCGYVNLTLQLGL